MAENGYLQIDNKQLVGFKVRVKPNQRCMPVLGYSTNFQRQSDITANNAVILHVNPRPGEVVLNRRRRDEPWPNEQRCNWNENKDLGTKKFTLEVKKVRDLVSRVSIDEVEIANEITMYQDITDATFIAFSPGVKILDVCPIFEKV